MNISSQSKLKEVVSTNPYLCFASCLEIVVDYLSGLSLDQSTIANYLGVTIPADDLHFFPNKPRKWVKISDRIEEWGIDVNTAKINSLLTEKDIPIKCDFKSAYLYEDWSFEEDISSLLTGKGVVIIGFDYHAVFNKNESSIIGHSVVGLEVVTNESKSLIRVFDPGPTDAGVKLIDLYELYVAAKRKGGGIWTFTYR